MMTMLYCIAKPHFLASFWTMFCVLVLLAFGLYLDPGGLQMPQPTVGEWVLSGFSAGSVYLSAYRCVAFVTVVVFFFRTLKKMDALIDDRTKVKMRDGLFRWSYMLTMTLMIIAVAMSFFRSLHILPQVASPAREALHATITLVSLSFFASDFVCLVRWRRCAVSPDPPQKTAGLSDRSDVRARGPLARRLCKVWRSINPPMETLPAANAYSLIVTFCFLMAGLIDGWSLQIPAFIVLMVAIIQFNVRRYARSLGLPGNASCKEMAAASKAQRDAKARQGDSAS